MSALVADTLKGGGAEWSFLEKGTITSNVAVDVEAYVLSGEWDAFKLVLSEFEVATDGDKAVLTVSVGGAEVTSGYRWKHMSYFSSFTGAGSAANIANSNSDTDVWLTTGHGNDTGYHHWVEIELKNVQQVAERGVVYGFSRGINAYDNAAGAPVGVMWTTWGHQSVSGNLTGINVAGDSGAIDAGTYYLYGRNAP